MTVKYKDKMLDGGMQKARAYEIHQRDLSN